MPALRRREQGLETAVLDPCQLQPMQGQTPRIGPELCRSLRGRADEVGRIGRRGPQRREAGMQERGARLQACAKGAATDLPQIIGLVGNQVEHDEQR